MSGRTKQSCWHANSRQRKGWDRAAWQGAAAYAKTI